MLPRATVRVVREVDQVDVEGGRVVWSLVPLGKSRKPNRTLKLEKPDDYETYGCDDKLKLQIQPSLPSSSSSSRRRIQKSK